MKLHLDFYAFLCTRQSQSVLLTQTLWADWRAVLHCISKFMFTTSTPLFYSFKLYFAAYRNMQTLSKRVLLMHQYLTWVNVVLITKENLVAENETCL